MGNTILSLKKGYPEHHMTSLKVRTNNQAVKRQHIQGDFMDINHVKETQGEILVPSYNLVGKGEELMEIHR